jgi:hypothetical protein
MGLDPGMGCGWVRMGRLAKQPAKQVATNFEENGIDLMIETVPTQCAEKVETVWRKNPFFDPCAH